MAAPTQSLPPWMTLSSAIVTDPDGSVFTSYTTLELPLTYYGPSIPLNSDWTYGGLTPPPSTTSTSSTSSASPSPSSVSSSSITSSAPSISMTASSTLTMPTTTSSTSASASSSAAVTSSHSSRSATVIGAILGSILGTLILVLLILIWLLLRRHRRRTRNATDRPAKSASSSFWNRSTTIFTRRKSRRQTPIWTEWQVVNPEDLETQQSPTRPQSPGEGTPRDSGDETDPFLNRTVRSGANEMTQTQTGTDTLVSMPVAAALADTASTRRSGTTTTHVGGPIMPRDELLARMNEEDAALQQVRLVSPTSADDDTAPLPLPPPLGAERRTGRMSHQETKSMRSLASAAFSASSEKSGSVDAHEPESAELLTARRVKVVNYGQPASEAGTASITSGTSGLERLANLPSMSWFRRMSFLPAPSRTRDIEHADNYTRTPPRSHSRQGSRSRPVSWAPLPTSEPTSLTPDSSTNRRPRPPTAFPRGFGHLDTEERPVSSVSAKSRASVSTVYHDARETPSSSLVDLNFTPAGTFGSNRSQPGSGIPPVPTLPHTRSAPLSPLAEQAPGMHLRGGYFNIPSTEPPTYEESHRDSPHSSGDRSEQVVDVLDLPVPRPASPFTAASGSMRSHLPPGLPTPAVWRESLATSGGTSSTSGIRIDVLEEAPPPAQDSWRTLSGGGNPAPGARRTTFGVVPAVVHARDTTQSEHASLASGRSHLSPHVLQSSGSTAPSYHSSSSKSHSQGPSGSTGSRSASHAGSITERSRLEQVSEVGSPPLSAVFSKEGAWTRPTSRPMSPIRQSPSSSADGELTFPAPLATTAGTVTSTATARTDDSGAHASVTTSGTDPVSGAILHFPALPYRGLSEHGHNDSRRDDDLMW